MLLYNVRKLNKGFTLLEMITVVIIVGVIAAIASPNFLGLLNRNRVTQGLSDVKGAINEAQRLAIRSSQICSIRFTSIGSGANERSIVRVTPPAGGNNFNGCLLQERELPRDVSFGLVNGASIDTINSASPVDLAFSAKGNPDATNIMVISHPNVNDQKCIQIQGLLGNIISGSYDGATGICTPD